MARYGRISFDDSDSKSSYNKEKYLKLEDGPNTIRIVTDPYCYFFHQIKFAEDKKNQYGHQVRCAIDNCPLCLANEAKKKKYIAGVLNRKEKDPTKVFKFLEFGTKIYGDMKTFRHDLPGLEDHTSYDVTIIRNPKGGAANFYTVVPAMKSPLTADEIELIENSGCEAELDALTKPITPDEVLEKIEGIKRWIAKQNAGNSPQEAKQEASEEPVKQVTEDMFAFKKMSK